MTRFACAAALLLTTSLSVSAAFCPFCSAPSLTLSEQMAQSDAVVLVKWVGGEKSEETETGVTPGSTTFEVLEISKDGGEDLEKGLKIQLPRYRAGKDGDLFVMTGLLNKSLDWDSPMEVTEASYQYIAQSPDPETDATKRLEYFMRFLEFPDETVANDAYAEFANAPYEDITPMAGKLPREKIAEWVADPNTPVTRMGLYGLLMGLCGNDADADVMKKKIMETSEEFRLGIDGVMSGYLLLKGADGLDLLDESKLKARTFVTDNGEEKKIPFSETYAAMQALRFMWTYGDGAIPKERLRKSMRLLLDRPELADLVIADLARWKDWKIQDKLMSMYDDEDFNIPAVKRAIIRYLHYCSKAGTAVAEAEGIDVPEVATQAAENLKALEEKDPKLVEEARRYLLN